MLFGSKGPTSCEYFQNKWIQHFKKKLIQHIYFYIKNTELTKEEKEKNIFTCVPIAQRKEEKHHVHVCDVHIVSLELSSWFAWGLRSLLRGRVLFYYYITEQKDKKKSESLPFILLIAMSSRRHSGRKGGVIATNPSMVIVKSSINNKN